MITTSAGTITRYTRADGRQSYELISTRYPDRAPVVAEFEHGHFVDSPWSMAQFIEMLSAAFPSRRQSALEDDGVRFEFKDGTKLHAWHDALLFRDADDNEAESYFRGDWESDAAGTLAAIFTRLSVAERDTLPACIPETTPGGG